MSATPARGPGDPGTEGANPRRPGSADTSERALRREILRLADSKRLLGIRYSDWLLGAPSIETGIACSAMAQDEWGHARLLYAILKDFGDEPVAVEHDRPTAEYASIGVLDGSPADWAGLVALAAVVDQALTVGLEGLGAGSHETARSRIPKMLAEEAHHSDFGLAWCRTLAAGSDEARRRIRDEIEALLAPSVRYVVPEDPVADRLANGGGTLPASELRERLRARLVPLCEAVGIEGSVLEAALAANADDEGIVWDGARGRTAGAPAEEAVERARGDRNRALFVE